VLAILASLIVPIVRLALATGLAALQAMVELPAIFVYVSWLVGQPVLPFV
jgi:hypothetical protein